MKYILISEEDLHSLILLAELAEYRTKMKFTLTDTLKKLKSKAIDLSENTVLEKVVLEYELQPETQVDMEFAHGYTQGIEDLIEEFT